MTIITNIPKQQRPREKLLKYGGGKLSDAELLAIFLRTGIKGKNAIELAQELLINFGGLRHLLASDLPTFLKHKGLGVAKYAQLQACLEMSKRCVLEQLATGTTIKNSSHAYDYICLNLSHYPHEVLAALLLDSKNRVITFVELSHGSTIRAATTPRAIVQLALKHHATNMILAHNHPSGDVTPSKSDIEFTRKLKELLVQLDIYLLDHVVIGYSNYCSVPC